MENLPMTQRRFSPMHNAILPQCQIAFGQTFGHQIQIFVGQMTNDVGHVAVLVGDDVQTIDDWSCEPSDTSGLKTILALGGLKNGRRAILRPKSENSAGAPVPDNEKRSEFSSVGCILVHATNKKSVLVVQQFISNHLAFK
uniref:Uncharacterized protein n=1 Tax=Romanomermis culicivorax TaxID=13658 RepID=A0A915IWX9_ROMCU